jgi:hypothetical protein
VAEDFEPFMKFLSSTVQNERCASPRCDSWSGKAQQVSRASKSERICGPIMMSAGVLLLIATGLLFLFSKPESTVPGALPSAEGTQWG